MNRFIILLVLWHAFSCAQSVSGEGLPIESRTSKFPHSISENAGPTEEVLAPDVAFPFFVELENASTIAIHWNIAKGYYLYRDQFKFALQTGHLAPPQLPPGQLKDDLEFGKVMVYYNELTIKLPIEDSQGLKTLTLLMTYQGCAEDKVCYPPLQIHEQIELPAAVVKKPPPDFLTAAEAFKFSAQWLQPTQLQLHWQIAEGYYLYREKFKFSLATAGQLGTPQFPTGTFREDPLFGKVEIYTQSPLEIPLPIAAQERQTVTLNVEYQGCALAGLCYPPVRQQLELAFGTESEQDRIAALFTHSKLGYLLAIFFGFGLLLAFTPCVYPMLPILNACIVGQGRHLTTFQAFLMSTLYVFAMALTYALLGALTGLMGENFQAFFQNPWILVLFAMLFVLLSLAMFGCYELQLPNRWQTRLSELSHRQSGGSWLGVTIMGILSALIVSPCVAAPLAGALIYIGQSGDALLGGIALFIMGLGMGAPIIVAGTFMGHFLPKAGHWMEAIKAIFGVLLLAVAIWMLERLLPGPFTMLLWAALLISAGIYLGALDHLSAGVSGWRKLAKSLGLICLVYGILLMMGAAKGNSNVWRPLEDQAPQERSSSRLSFKSIKGLTELEQELKRASGKLVMLDFYADWCIACKELEQFTFTNAQVQAKLANTMLLRTDVTANDESDRTLYQHFGIYGPPAILFFKDGQEQRVHRVIGFLSAASFLQHLEQLRP